MNEPLHNNEQGSRERRLLGLGVFIAVASIGFLFQPLAAVFIVGVGIWLLVVVIVPSRKAAKVGTQMTAVVFQEKG